GTRTRSPPAAASFGSCGLLRWRLRLGLPAILFRRLTRHYRGISESAVRRALTILSGFRTPDHAPHLIGCDLKNSHMTWLALNSRLTLPTIKEGSTADPPGQV